MAQTIKKGTMLADIAPTYTNDYCSVSWLDYSDQLLAELQQSFIDIDYYKTHRQKLSSVIFLSNSHKAFIYAVFGVLKIFEIV